MWFIPKEFSQTYSFGFQIVWLYKSVGLENYLIKFTFDVASFTEESLDSAEKALRGVDLDGKIKSLSEAKNNHQRYA
jgi:hypothetical protein